jgi:hypothetical protein
MYERTTDFGNIPFNIPSNMHVALSRFVRRQRWVGWLIGWLIGSLC